MDNYGPQTLIYLDLKRTQETAMDMPGRQFNYFMDY